ncbi:MAG: hypothetical protein ACK4TG_10935, partial [Thermaurantiacus sp.]
MAFPAAAQELPAPAPPDPDSLEAILDAPLPPLDLGDPVEAPEPIPPAPRQRFDFYTLLPEREVVVPEPQARPARPGAPLPPPPKVEEP